MVLVLASLVGCGARGCAAPARPPVLVKGSSPGATKVRLVEEERDIIIDVAPAADGAWTIAVPASAAKAPRILVEGTGGSRVVSGQISVDAGDVTMPPLRPWRSPVDVKREGPRVRFSWPPIGEGPGVPAVVRYSLLFSFATTKESGLEHGEATLVTHGTEAVQDLDELAGLMRDRDPAKRQVTVTVRAYDPRDPTGPTWSGGPQDWELPADLPAK
jgi:hypothetical protein